MQETATKEAAMATRLEEVQAELKQARLALGNAHAEIDRIGGLSGHLKKVWLIIIIIIIIIILSHCTLSYVDKHPHALYTNMGLGLIPCQIKINWWLIFVCIQLRYSHKQFFFSIR